MDVFRMLFCYTARGTRVCVAVSWALVLHENDYLMDPGRLPAA
jgi:hypothetical protein